MDEPIKGASEAAPVETAGAAPNGKTAPANGGAEPQPAGGQNGSPAEAAVAVDLEAQLTEARAEAAKNLDGWQRAAAEFANYRKRIDKETKETYQNATVETLRKILPIIDDFDRAIQFIPADRASDVTVDGFKQIHRKLIGLLETAGVKILNPVDQPFDPAFHEAIGQDEGTGKPSGQVTAVLQKGYVYGEKVLRAALVRVAS